MVCGERAVHKIAPPQIMKRGDFCHISGLFRRLNQNFTTTNAAELASTVTSALLPLTEVIFPVLGL